MSFLSPDFSAVLWLGNNNHLDILCALTNKEKVSKMSILKPFLILF